MATKKKGSSTAPNSLFAGMDPKIKMLLVLGILLALFLVFMKTPQAEKLGLNFEGMTSNASMMRYDPYFYSAPDPEFYGGPITQTTNTPIMDRRIEITSPRDGSKLIQNNMVYFAWNTLKNLEVRSYQVSLHAMNCPKGCPVPVILGSGIKTNYYRARIPGSLPAEMTNQSVWLRVTADGVRYFEIPVTIARY